MKLRHDRAVWVAHCRAVQSAKDERVKADDGMSHGMIPFGAISQWASIENQRLKAALATSVPARITGWDESGVSLLITCPYCEQEHQHIVVPDDWAPDELMLAICGRGCYIISVTPAK